MEDVRLDIQTLRVLIDLALDKGEDGIMLQAFANVLTERRERLEKLRFAAADDAAT
jgi:hypothetical protein